MSATMGRIALLPRPAASMGATTALRCLGITACCLEKSGWKATEAYASTSTASR